MWGGTVPSVRQLRRVSLDALESVWLPGANHHLLSSDPVDFSSLAGGDVGETTVIWSRNLTLPHSGHVTLDKMSNLCFSFLIWRKKETSPLTWELWWRVNKVTHTKILRHYKPDICVSDSYGYCLSADITYVYKYTYYMFLNIYITLERFRFIKCCNDQMFP